MVYLERTFIFNGIARSTMHAFSSANSEYTHSLIEDEYLSEGILCLVLSLFGRVVMGVLWFGDVKVNEFCVSRSYFAPGFLPRPPRISFTLDQHLLLLPQN